MTEFPIKTTRQFGSVLQGFRRDQKLSQGEVGARVGLRQNAISQIEADPGQASLKRLFKVLAALDLELTVRPRSAGKRSDSGW